MTEQDTNWGENEEQSAPETTPRYPEHPSNPHNHRFTVSMDNRGPMVVVRANTATEVNEAFQELETAGTTGVLAGVFSHLKAEMQVAQGLGPVTPVQAPQGAPVAPQAPAMPQAPQFPTMGTMGQQMAQQGPPPQWAAPAAIPQQGGNSRGPKPRPADWPQVYKIDVPFNAKDQFKAFREENKDYFKGKIQWAGGGGYWVHGDVAQSLGNFNPVPA